MSPSLWAVGLSVAAERRAWQPINAAVQAIVAVEANGRRMDENRTLAS
jgi:hypothetical protein